MVINYMAASIVGGVATAVLASQHGLLLGLAVAPLGGSVSALALSLLRLYSSSPHGRGAVPREVVWC